MIGCFSGEFAVGPVRRWAVGVAAAISLAGPASAAVVEMQNAVLSGPAPFAIFDGFDTAKGTLDRVDISITGVMQLDFLTAANMAPVPVPFPVPYTAGARIRHDFGGVVDSGPDPAFDVVVPALGVLAPVTVPIDFRYGFSLDETSDLAGFIAETPSSVLARPIPGFLQAERADFAVPAPRVLSLQPLPASLDPRLIWLGSNTSANLQVAYHYTPSSGPGTSVVPLPAGLPLAVSALGLLAVFRRR